MRVFLALYEVQDKTLDLRYTYHKVRIVLNMISLLTNVTSAGQCLIKFS